MTTQSLIISKYRADEITTIEGLVQVAYELGRKEGQREMSEQVPVNNQIDYERGYLDGVESVDLDLDKIALSHLIPKEGLRNWNEMSPEERMTKMHEVWGWNKSRAIEL